MVESVFAAGHKQNTANRIRGMTKREREIGNQKRPTKAVFDFVLDSIENYDLKSTY